MSDTPESSAAVVFVVDDETEILDMYKSFLSIKGYTPRCFETADAAFKEISAGAKPEVIITDVKMPGMSGIEFVEKLREIGFKRPVIVATGFADKDTAIKALHLNVAAFLEKPFEAKRLRSVIENAVASHRRELANAALIKKFTDIGNSMLSFYDGSATAKDSSSPGFGTDETLKNCLHLTQETYLAIDNLNAELKRQSDSVKAEFNQALLKAYEVTSRIRSPSPLVMEMIQNLEDVALGVNNYTRDSRQSIESLSGLIATMRSILEKTVKG